MWVRKRIDIGWSDIALGLGHCLWSNDRDTSQLRLRELWAPSKNAIACLSVRSGFDLLLETLQLPKDSEIVMSAVTIPDMPRIVHDHGLVPVPVDLDMARVAPKVDLLRAVITPRTRVIVIAHLFGGRVDLDPILELAHARDILVIEDCAQAFVGIDDTGHRGADISMFSFGPIKTNTALGGAILTVRNQGLRRRMNEVHRKWPTQSRWAFMRRLMKYAFVKTLSTRPVASLVAKSCRLVGTDHDRLATGMARGFAGPHFFRRIRQQPSTPLLQILLRRLAQFDPTSLTSRVQNGQWLAQKLSGVIPVLGKDSIQPTYWVLPVVVEHPQQLVKQLWAAGFDATYSSSLTLIESDARWQHLPLDEARAVLEKTVFLPFSEKMPRSEVRRMADIVMTAKPAKLNINLHRASSVSQPVGSMHDTSSHVTNEV